MGLNRENLDASARCSPATFFCDRRMVPLTRSGKPFRVGYRICKNFDCIQPKHITQSRYIAKKVYGYVPPLYKKYRVEPLTYEELAKIAKPVDRDIVPEFCQVPGCNLKHAGLNLCNAHHGQYYRYRQERGLANIIKRDNSDIEQYMLPPKGNELLMRERYCHYPECARPYFARGLCKTHHKRWLRWKQANGLSRQR